MQYKIIGEPFPVVECTLNAGEKMKCQSGAMAWMNDKMVMQTKSGGIGKMFGKALTGESMFTNEYTAEGGEGVIAFNTGVPGYILAVDVTPEKSIITQKKAFLASEANVDMEVTTNPGVKTGIFGGEGFLMQKYVGSGKVFLEIDGAVIEKELAAGEKMVLSTGMLAAMENTVVMSTEKVGGVANSLLGGEGFFNTTVTGPGKVWLQTMPVSELAGAIKPFIPTK